MQFKQEQIQNKQVHNLFELSAADKNTLREKIKSNNGQICVIIHPYFIEYKMRLDTPGLDVYKLYPQLKRIKQAVERLLEKKGLRITPMVFETQANTTETTERLGKILNKSGNEIFMIPTQPNSSEPKFPSPAIIKDEKLKKQNWAQLLKLFNEIEVKGVIIIGTTLETVPIQEGFEPLDGEQNAYREQRKKLGAKNMAYNLKQCVGEAVTKLANAGIEVKISNLTFPGTIKDIKLLEEIV